MLLVLADAVIVLGLILATAYAANKFIELNRKSQIDQALAEQKLAAELAKRAEQINPEQINNNNSKVKDTLDKIN